MPSIHFLSELSALPGSAIAPSVVVGKATIVLAIGFAVARLLSRSPAGTRHLVWLAVLGTLLALPALTTWTRVEIHLLPPRTAPAYRSPAAAAGAPSEAVRRVDRAAPAADAVSAVVEAPTASSAVPAIGAASLLIGIWAAVALLVLASLAWSALAVGRLVRRARPLTLSAWHTSLLEVADRLGLEALPRLLVSRDVAMPFACGVFAPTIVLPADSAAWTADRCRAVLLHELAHVRRRDLIAHALSRIVCALYWFHPLVWTAAKRLRTESERACDDLALACGTRALDYAEHLLEIVTAVRTHATPAVALAMARRNEFEGRMLAILDPDLRRTALNRRQSVLLTVSLVLVGGLVASAAPVPRAVAAPVAAISSAAAPGVSSPTYGALIQPPVRVTVRRTPQGASAVAGPVAQTAPPAVPPVVQSATPARADSVREDERPALLAKVLRTDANASLRRVAAWGLEAYADAPAATEALVGAVGHDADPRVREMAAWSLASTDGHHREVADALATALRKDASEEVRATSAWSLGNIGADGAVDALVAALSDSSRDVRQRATWALGSLGIKQAPAPLVAELRDRDKDTRELAAWALYQIEDPSALPALEAALRTETDEDTQLGLLRAIAVDGDRSVDALRGLLESPDARIKSMAIRALAGGHATGPWPWPWPEPRPEP